MLQNSSYKLLFDGVFSYTRIGLTEFSALNLLNDQESVVPYDVVYLYLPMIFHSVVSSDKLRTLIQDDKAHLIANYVEGEIYLKDTDDKVFVDYHQLAIGDSKKEMKDSKKSLDDKYDSVLTKDLSQLYQERKADIRDYLKFASSLNEEPDPLVTHEDPTITSVVRSKMDKSSDAANGLK